MKKEGLTRNIVKTGKGISEALMSFQLLIDSYGVASYYLNGKNSSYAASPQKATLNTIVNYVGLKMFPEAAIFYNIVDNMYPGGWQGYAADWHHVIYPGWYTWPTHKNFEKK